MSQITRERPVSSASVSAQPLKSATKRRKPKYDYRDEIRRTPVLQIPNEHIWESAGIEQPPVRKDCLRLVQWLREQGCSFGAIGEAYFWLRMCPGWDCEDGLTIGRLYRDKAAPYRWGLLVDWRMCNGKSLEPVIRDSEGHEFFVSQKLLQKL